MRVIWMAIVLAGLGTGLPPCLAAEMRLTSPNGRIAVTVSDADQDILYAVAVDGRDLIAGSKLGLRLGDAHSATATSLGAIRTRVEDSVWSPVYGKRNRVRNHFREGEFELAGLPVSLVVRAYDDGVAFRYRIAGGDSETTIRDEVTEFRFVRDLAWWSYRRERAPQSSTRATEIDGMINYPLVAKTPDGPVVALLEAHLRDYPWAVFTGEAGQPGFRIPLQQPVSVTPPFETPWRVMLIGDSYGHLIDSDLVANLNPKADRDAFAWLKPGVSFWDWRAWGYQAEGGFTYDLDLPSWKRFIDLAAESGVPYLLLDADWYGPEFKEDSHPLTGGKSADVKAAIEYGRERGVGLILYLNHVAGKKYGVEEIIKAYADWGAKGIKYGFMSMQDPLEKVQWTHRIASLCAKNRLLVNFHDGPVPPTGEEVTLPNFVHREFCHAQSDAKRAFGPGGFIRMMHVNMLAGPIDMNNGMFDLVSSRADRPKVFVQVDSTILAEAARTLITYGGGVTVIPDAADSYRKHPELFRFISLQRQPWIDSRTLESDIDSHIVMMRRSGDVYLVGSATNEEARDLDIPLDFLPEGTAFQASLFEDAADSHFQKNRMAYRVSKRTVGTGDTIRAHLAPGSGHCIILEPIE